MKDLYVVNCCRTAIGSFGGSLSCADGSLVNKHRKTNTAKRCLFFYVLIIS